MRRRLAAFIDRLLNRYVTYRRRNHEQVLAEYQRHLTELRNKDTNR